MKKDIFNFRRFGKYFMSDVRTCTANYGLNLITLSILSFLALYVCHVGFGLLFGNEWNGPDAGLRFFVFAVVMFCIIITMPVKCYGKLTEKQYGSQWLMIPASKPEKFLSMSILTCLVVPIIGSMLYLTLDALVCALDPTCGNSLFGWAADLENRIQEIMAVSAEPGYETFKNFMIQLKNPLMYIDDAIQMPLPFLLGALCFKSSKTVKTFLSLAALGTIFSIISTPLALQWSEVMVTSMTDMEDPAAALEIFNNSWFFKNIVLVDTICDTIVNLGLFAAIFFRIKTLKH